MPKSSAPGKLRLAQLHRCHYRLDQQTRRRGGRRLTDSSSDVLKTLHNNSLSFLKRLGCRRGVCSFSNHVAACFSSRNRSQIAARNQVALGIISRSASRSISIKSERGHENVTMSILDRFFSGTSSSIILRPQGLGLRWLQSFHRTALRVRDGPAVVPCAQQ